MIDSHLDVKNGIGEFRARGECSPVEAVDFINAAIAHCRDRGIAKVLVKGTGLVGVSVPSLVDRFLMVEEWAQESKGMVVVVVVVLVVRAEYIHPQKFGVKIAADFGLTTDVYTRKADAFEWLSSAAAKAGNAG